MGIVARDVHKNQHFTDFGLDFAQNILAFLACGSNLVQTAAGYFFDVTFWPGSKIHHVKPITGNEARNSEPQPQNLTPEKECVFILAGYFCQDSKKVQINGLLFQKSRITAKQLTGGRSRSGPKRRGCTQPDWRCTELPGICRQLLIVLNE